MVEDKKTDEQEDDDLSIDFSKLKGFFGKKKKSKEKKEEKAEAKKEEKKEEAKEDKDEELNIDFSGVKRFFKMQKKEGAEEEKEEEIAVDWKRVGGFFARHKTFFLVLIPIFLCIFMRLQPAFLPITDDWARDTVYNNIRAQISTEVDKQYPNLPSQNKNILIENKFNEVLKQNKDSIEQQVRGTSNYFKSQLQDDSGHVYMGDIDPYFWMLHARNIVNNGHPGDIIKDGVSWDMHMYAPKGREVPEDMFHAYLEGYLYKFFRFFNRDLTIMHFCFYVPVLLAVLCVIPAFFIARRIAGDVGGLFASVMFAIHPAFLNRTMAGVADTDVYNGLFPLFITWVFLEALESESIKKEVILTAVAGFLTGLYSWAWGGWWFIFDFILAATIIHLFYYIFTHRKELKKMGLACFVRQKAIKGTLLTIVVFIVFSGIFTTIFISFDVFVNAPLAPVGFTRLKEISTLWPNVYTTVAEQNPTTWPEVVSSIGGKFLLFISIMGVLLTLFKKDKYGKTDVKYAILFAIWYGATMYASVKGIRYILLFVPAFAIGFGIFSGLVHRYFSGWMHKELKVSKIISAAIVFVILCTLIISPVKSSYATAIRGIPLVNDAWYDSLDGINKNADKNAIINSWWDFGHWFKFIGDRAVTFDGTSQNTPMAHWMGKVLLTDDEKLAVGILRMLDCSSNDAFVELDKVVNYTPKSVDILKEIVVVNKEEARRILLKYGLKENEAESVLRYTHCEPPEDYFITSQDMIGKSGVWSHFGSWDFYRADIYETVEHRNRSEDAEKTIATLKQKFNLSDELANSYYSEIQTADENQWISGWPGYASGLSGCNVNQDTAECGNSIRVNLTNYDARIATQEGIKHLTSLAYADKNGFYVKEFEDDTVPYSAALIPDGKGYDIIMMSPELAGSMYTRLFFYDGHGLKYFDLFSHKKSVFGEDIYVWKVDWLGKDANVMEEFVPKTTVHKGDTATVSYIGWFENGTIFDSSIVDWQNKRITKETDMGKYQHNAFSFITGNMEVISGFDDAVIGMNVSEVKAVEIPPEKGYGLNPAVHPLANKTLYFKIKVEKIE